MPFDLVAELIVRGPVLAGMDRMQPEPRTLVNEHLLRFTGDSTSPHSVLDEGAELALWGTEKNETFLD